MKKMSNFYLIFGKKIVQTTLFYLKKHALREAYPNNKAPERT